MTVSILTIELRFMEVNAVLSMPFALKRTLASMKVKGRLQESETDLATISFNWKIEAQC